MTEHVDHSATPTARRSFVGRLLGGAMAMTILGGSSRTLLAESLADTHPGDDWMKELTGKHRTVLDMSAHKNGKPLGPGQELSGWMARRLQGA